MNSYSHTLWMEIILFMSVLLEELSVIPTAVSLWDFREVKVENNECYSELFDLNILNFEQAKNIRSLPSITKLT